MEAPPASPADVRVGFASAASASCPKDPCQATAERFVALVDSGSLQVPLPGSGRTWERFHALCRLGRHDLCVARLAEGRLDAVAVLDELGGPKPKLGERWGVWAARPPGPGLKAVGGSADWRLTGTKPYCSGARVCTHTLVTADTAQGRRLFAVRVEDRGGLAAPGTWQAVGMAGSDSLDVTFHDVPAEPVGDVGDYVDRPGFPHGGIGVAARWLGGAQAVAATLVAEAGRRVLDEHAAAHLGQTDVLLHTAETLLGHAADEIDRGPYDRLGVARVRSLRVRGLVERGCTEILQHVGRPT